MDTNSKNITVLFPGSFKPMTGGHLSLIKKYAEHPDVKEVQVFIGPGIRNGIDQQLAYEVSKELTKDIPNVKLLPSKYPTPILTSYKVIETANPGIYCLAASSKGDDYTRVKEFTKEHQLGGKYYRKEVKVIELPVEVTPDTFKNRWDEFKEQPISASIIRNDIINKDYDNFKTGYPEYSKPSLIYGMLKDYVVKDGKNAIKRSRSLTERELFNTYRTLVNELINILGVKQEHIVPIGSFGKKPINQRYGDLDIALKTNLSFEDVANRMEHLGKFETIRIPGFNQVTIGYPIIGDSENGIAQVDLMLTDNLEWSKFVYKSPNFKLNESKYKGAYSSFMRMSIISEGYKKVNSQDEKGFTIEYEMLSMRLNSGVWKVTKTHQGKKGLIKTAKIKSEEFISNNSDEVIELMFGKTFDKSKTSNFEYIWDYMLNNPFFPHKKKLPEILSKFKHLLKGSKLPELNLKIEEKRQLNDHMYHIEQLLFEGEEGLDFIKYTFNQLTGAGHIDSKLSVKIDGAPAMMLWSSFPGLRPYGVGTKTVFNKVPVTCHSPEEVNEKFGDRPDLADKLKQLLSFAKNIEIPKGEIWQGDFLFNNDSKETDNKTFVSFRPNTIRYSLDIHSKEGIKVLWSVFGIVWHTRYTGDNIKNVQPHFNIDLTQLVGHPSLYMTHPYFQLKDFSSPSIKELFNKIDHIRFNNQYKSVLQYKTFGLLFEKYHNKLIKEQKELKFRIFKTVFPYFVDNEKTGGSGQKMRSFIEKNSYVIEQLIELTNDIIKLKKEFLKELNKYETYEAYVDLKEGGSKRINQEGFALSSPSSKVVKIVNRDEFFYLNSSPDIIKGWEK